MPSNARNSNATGATVWLTGLPAAGKTTLARALLRELRASGLPVELLDGDELRRHLSSDLGFAPEDRAEQARRVAQLAFDAATRGAVAIVALVSPYARDRAAARALHERAGLRFVEVFVDTPLEECERRDPKGLYARARRGELDELTGISSPYERPRTPEVTVRDEPVDAALAEIARELAGRAPASAPRP